MSDLVNDQVKEEIMEDILEMADKDIWNVIFAIEKEFGVQNMPSPKGMSWAEDCERFINKLFELRFEVNVPIDKSVFVSKE